MAGTLPGFDADGFRDAIRFAMNMGAPPDEGQQATFYFPKIATSAAPVDGRGVPFAPGTPVSRVPSKPPVRVVCGIEDAASDSDETGFGSFGQAIIITMFDEEFATVEGFEFVAVGGVRYDYARLLLPRGLGPVGIYRILCTGEGQR